MKKREEKSDFKNTVSTKERSKIYRERKKKYYVKLEKKIEELQAENTKLKNANAQLQKELASHNEFVKVQNWKKIIDQEEVFLHEGLPKLIENNPESFRFTLLDSARDKYCTFGTFRINLLKESFQTIIDYWVSSPYKAFIAISNHLTLNKLVKIGQQKHKSTSNKYKFRKVTLEEEKFHSHNYSSKHKKKDEITSIISELNFSENILSNWKEVGNEFNSMLKDLRKIIKKLIRTRNTMFKLLKKLHDFLDEGKIYHTMNYKDVTEISKMCQKIQGSELVSPHGLWMLGKKNPKVGCKNKF
jgi:hypothetical protein